MTILVVTYWSYQDPLIQAYTLPYVKIMQKILPEGSRIYLFTLEKKERSLDKNTREKIRNNLLKDNIHLISGKYAPFGPKAIFRWTATLFRLKRLCTRHKISTIHAWCTPAGMIGYILSKWTGIPLVIDSYEPHADSMIENGTWKKQNLSYKILSHFEKKQTQHAQAIIGLTAKTQEYAKDRFHKTLNNFYIKPACVDLDLFNPAAIKYPEEFINTHQLKDKIIGVYAGKFGGIYLGREIFDLFKACSCFWGKKFIALILSETDSESITHLANESSFDTNQLIHLCVPHHQIPKYLSLADFAINPVKPVPSKRFCTSIKDGEYWAMGLPVIIPPNISDDSEIIERTNSGVILRKFDTECYNNAVRQINSLITNEDRLLLSERIRQLAVKYRNFKIAGQVYFSLYQDEE